MTSRMALGVAAVIAGLGVPAEARTADDKDKEAAVLDLKDGHQVVGVIVAEKPGAYFVDLGFDVIRVPKDQVVNRRKRGDAAPAAAVASGDSDPKGFYKINPGRSRPVKELVREFGEGVISVETPAASARASS